MHNAHTLPVDAVLLLGPTGSGKSPLGDLFTQRGFLGRTAHHLDFGSALRAAANGASSRYSDSELSFIRDVLQNGSLLEDKHFPLARKIISDTLEKCRFSPPDVLILNGIPRHVGQAYDMDAVAAIQALVVLDCGADVVSCRLRINSGGDRKGREDDDPELVRKKLAVFHERTRPLIDYYDRRGIKIYRLSIGERSTGDEVFQAFSRLAAGDPPVSLVTEPPQG